MALKNSNGSKNGSGLWSAMRTPMGLWLTIALVLAVCSFIGVIVTGVLLHSMNVRMAGAESELSTLKDAQTLLLPGWVSLKDANVQPIGLGFLVVDLACVTKDGGVYVKGNVINTTAIDHYNTHFRLEFEEGRSAEFTVSSLRSGHSGGFEAIIPPPGDSTIPERGRILYLGSEVTYN